MQDVAICVKSTPWLTLPIFFKHMSFSYFNQQRKISKFGDFTTIDVHFTAKIRPKNSPILMKLGIYNQHTSNQKRTKFYWNRTIFDSKFFRFSKKGRLKILIISNFNCPMTILNHGRHRLSGSFCYPYNHSSLTVWHNFTSVLIVMDQNQIFPRIDISMQQK